MPANTDTSKYERLSFNGQRLTFREWSQTIGPNGEKPNSSLTIRYRWGKWGDPYFAIYGAKGSKPSNKPPITALNMPLHMIDLKNLNALDIQAGPKY